MEVWCLGSGSRGNAFGVRHRDTTILIDAGFGPKALNARAEAVDFPLGSLDALVLTHEHGDHASGAAKLAETHDIPVYATRGTLRALQVSILCRRHQQYRQPFDQRNRRSTRYPRK